MRIWFIISVLSLINLLGYSQSITDLQNHKENTLKEIDLTTRLLNEVDKNKNSSLNQLQLLNNQINQRNQLIAAISSEIESYEELIADNEMVTNLLNSDLEKIKAEYAKMIRSAYRNKNETDQLMFLLAADDFNQAFRRYQYYKKYTTYRINQVQLMKSLEEVLNLKSTDLKLQNELKQELVRQTIEVRETLLTEKKEQTSELRKLQDQQQNLQQILAQQRKVEQELETEIQEIIAETGSENDENSFALTPEQKLIGENFEQNKLRLSWPVVRGVITEHFGIHQHPVLANVQIRNNGISIITVANAKVHAVFNGEVSRVFGITGGNTAVIIRHGNYLSVYSNLREVIVKKGDIVATGQEIGTVYTETEERNSILKFQIWLENLKLNPEEWIGR